MLLIYILLCLFFIFLLKETKKLNVSLFLALILLIFSQSLSVPTMIIDFITLISDVVISKTFIILIAILILINCITELIMFLGQHELVEKYISKKSTFIQKTYVHIISAFSTNINFRSSELVAENQNIFDSSSFLMSTLLIISIPFLMIFFYFFPTLLSLGNLTVVCVALVLTNFFAIFWFIKRIVDFKLGRDRTYNYYSDLLVHEEKRVRSANQKILFKNFFKRAFVFVLLVSGIIAFTSINLMFGAFIYLVIIFIDLFITVEIFSFKTKLVSEKKIYMRLFFAVKKMVKNLVSFIFGMLFIAEATNLLSDFTFYNNESLVFLFVTFTCVSVTATYYTKNYVTGFIIAIPIINIFVLNYPFFEEYFILIFVLQGAVLFSYFLSIIHINISDKTLIREITFMFLTCVIAYLLLVIFSSIITSLLVIILSILFYYFRTKRLNENL